MKDTLTDQTRVADILPKIGEIADSRSRDDRKAFDRQLGARVKVMRGLWQISQETLARELGLTFQQVQKYETGANRFPISRLISAARVLECSAAFLIGESQAGENELIGSLGSRPDVAKLLRRALAMSPEHVRTINQMIDQFGIGKPADKGE